MDAARRGLARGARVSTIALALLVGACSTADAPDPAVTWTGQLCDIVEPVTSAPPQPPEPDLASFRTGDEAADAYVAWRRVVDPPWVMTRQRWLAWAGTRAPRPDLDAARREVLRTTQSQPLNTGATDPEVDAGLLRAGPTGTLVPRDLAIVAAHSRAPDADRRREFVENMRSLIVGDPQLATLARPLPQCSFATS